MSETWYEINVPMLEWFLFQDVKLLFRHLEKMARPWHPLLARTERQKFAANHPRLQKCEARLHLMHHDVRTREGEQNNNRKPIRTQGTSRERAATYISSQPFTPAYVQTCVSRHYAITCVCTNICFQTLCHKRPKTASTLVVIHHPTPKKNRNRQSSRGTKSNPDVGWSGIWKNISSKSRFQFLVVCCV